MVPLLGVDNLSLLGPVLLSSLPERSENDLVS